jgi:hypothetical protein
MSLRQTKTIEECLNLNWPIHVVYREEDKQIVEWWPFGDKLAQTGAEQYNAKFGPDSHSYAVWDRYVFIRERHEKHLKQLEEIERRL